MQTVQPARANAKNSSSAFHQRRRRRKPLPSPPGQPSDKDMINDFILQRGITVCAPGRAMGSLKSSVNGLDM
jgi:hypothetical protein